jgi:hypothetical protein
MSAGLMILLGFLVTLLICVNADALAKLAGARKSHAA